MGNWVYVVLVLSFVALGLSLTGCAKENLVLQLTGQLLGCVLLFYLFFFKSACIAAIMSR